MKIVYAKGVNSIIIDLEGDTTYSSNQQMIEIDPNLEKKLKELGMSLWVRNGWFVAGDFDVEQIVPKVDLSDINERDDEGEGE